MTANLARIGFDDGILKAGKYKHKADEDFQHPAFVPLADVADNVWRPDLKNPERKPFARREDENNHFADMDQEGTGEEFGGKTLLGICEDPAKVAVDVWARFYDSLKGHVNPGALPFRVWQIYQNMVHFAEQKKVDEFVCAAGLLAHYVGDACQPLHISRLHHGDRKATDSKEIKDKKGAVHSVYETRMLDQYKNRGLNGEDDNEQGLVDGINKELDGKKASADVSGGHEAAVSVVRMMRNVVKTLPPEKIVAAFPLEGTPSEQATVLWGKFKNKTIICIAQGCLRLASLWESAWKEGQGSKIDSQDLVAIPPSRLQKLYQDKTFLRSVALKDYKDILE
jgi:hypothetical protein